MLYAASASFFQHRGITCPNHSEVASHGESEAVMSLLLAAPKHCLRAGRAARPRATPAPT